ncbi:hypothetical protein [Alkaliphilus sp. B6464]|uniref:hypothetical protein n=1 Tax=Alkaliphilus sp. B6464 TaxID=2731219 RepID=UPI001BAD3D01|nr:hypothetical protein [Alkaliphilus sp. B6464]QUH21908.1 hypothetical protein HYG84_18400 [Alkaliphilus sp. B6464]
MSEGKVINFNKKKQEKNNNRDVLFIELSQQEIWVAFTRMKKVIEIFFNDIEQQSKNYYNFCRNFTKRLETLYEELARDNKILEQKQETRICVSENDDKTKVDSEAKKLLLELNIKEAQILLVSFEMMNMAHVDNQLNNKQLNSGVREYFEISLSLYKRLNVAYQNKLQNINQIFYAKKDK